MRDLRTIVLTNNDADEAKRLLANMEAGRPATTNDPSEEFGGTFDEWSGLDNGS